MTAKEHRRGPWSQEEDQYLLALVKTHGPTNWVKISSIVQSRTPKQCRERFHQNLKPSLNTDAITPEEGQEIEKLVNEMGKRWAEIARRLRNRSDNAVKNWWNGGVNRRKRRDHRRGDVGAPSHQRVHQQQMQSLHMSAGAYQPQPHVSSSQYDPRLYSQENGLQYHQQGQPQLPPLVQSQHSTAYLHPPVQHHYSNNSRQGYGESLLPSPASETFPSQRTSMDAAPPSLVSDHGSAGSYYSPASPTTELGPQYQHPSYGPSRDSFVRSIPACQNYSQYNTPAAPVSSYSSHLYDGKSPSTYYLPSNGAQPTVQDSSYGSDLRHQSSYSTPRAQDQSSYAEVPSYQQSHDIPSSYRRRLPQGQRDLPTFHPPSRMSHLPTIEPKLPSQGSSPPKDGRMGLNRIVN